MNSREQELLKKIESNKEKRIQNAANESKLRAIEEEDAAYQAELEQIQQAKAEQEAAQQTRIEEATADAAYFLDNLVIEGLTMRELSGGEDQYQMLRIAVQTKIINLAEENSKQIAELQAEENSQKLSLQYQVAELKVIIENGKSANATLTRENGDLRSFIAQVNLDKEDAEAKRDAAVRELESANAEITRLESHVDDLRKEIAVGARNAYKVIDSEEQGKQMKELADRIKASRIHVYDVTPDNEINPKNYTAKRADNGEEITYNWTQTKNYIEITDTAEVRRFRDEHAVKEDVSNFPLDEPVQVVVTPEVLFPELPSAIAPEVPNILATGPVDMGHASTTGESIQTIEARVAALEAHVFGFVKVAS